MRSENWVWVSTIHKGQLFGVNILLNEWHQNAALIAPRAASCLICVDLPLPRKYMYTCCTFILFLLLAN